MHVEHLSGAPSLTADAHTRTVPKSSAANHSDGLALYHAVWKKVGDTFFNHERLQRWARWEHRFDRKISKTGNATKFISKMLKSLKDEYTWLRTPEEVAGDTDLHEGESHSGIGVMASFTPQGAIIRSVFSGSPAEKAMLKSRDVIVAIDGMSVLEMGEAETWRTLRGKRGTTASLHFIRDGQDWECRVVRAKVSTPSVYTDVLDGGIGYLRIESFQQLSTVEQMRRALKQKLAGCDKIVLDLRGNTGGYIEYALDCAAMLIAPSSELCSTIERVAGTTSMEVTVNYCGRRSDLNRPDAEILARMDLSAEEAVEAVVKWNRVRRRGLVPAETRMVVLIDRDTASAGEILAGALMDSGRALAIGERTFGKGIGQTTFKMPGGFDVQVTTLQYRTPSGAWPGDAQLLRKRLKPHRTVRGRGRFLNAGIAVDKQLSAACKELSGRQL